MLSSGIPFRRFHRVYERLNPPTRIYASVAALLDLARVPVTDRGTTKDEGTTEKRHLKWSGKIKNYSFFFFFKIAGLTFGHCCLH